MPTKKPARKSVMKVKKVNLASKKKDACCSSSCCCCGGKCSVFWTVIVIIVVVAAVAYLAYGEYMKAKTAPYTVKEKNGVTTVNPGPGLVPSSPPAVTPPTAPPPTN